MSENITLEVINESVDLTQVVSNDVVASVESGSVVVEQVLPNPVLVEILSGATGPQGPQGEPAPVENFFSLASGFVTVETLSPIATGEVIRYTYQGGATRYRFIANDNSLDAFYRNYEGGVFSNLVTTKRITI
jgi:hypothetical protein